MTNKDEGSSPKEEEQKVKFYKLFSFADKKDVTLMVVGSLAAMANGLSFPIMSILFGEVIDSFATNSADTKNIVKEVSKV